MLEKLGHYKTALYLSIAVALTNWAGALSPFISGD